MWQTFLSFVQPIRDNGGMLVHTDFPSGLSFDARNIEASKLWWDTSDGGWVRVNLVTDALGNTVGLSGTSEDLSGGADRDLVLALRAIADVVVLGGTTVRREPLSVPRDTPVVIVSRSANIPAESVRRARGGIVVLHHSSAIPPAGVTGVVLPRFTGSAIVSAIRALGHRRIVVEGGLTIVNKILTAGLVTEWCQTISPMPGNPNERAVAPAVTGELTLMAHDDDGYRYTRRLVDGAPRRDPVTPA